MRTISETGRPTVTEPRLVSMRELSQNTSGVISEVVDAGQTAVVSKRGRLVALIVPIPPGAIESAALDRALSFEPGHFRLIAEESDSSGALSTAEAADALGIEVPPFD